MQPSARATGHGERRLNITGPERWDYETDLAPTNVPMRCQLVARQTPAAIMHTIASFDILYQTVEHWARLEERIQWESVRWARQIAANQHVNVSGPGARSSRSVLGRHLVRLGRLSRQHGHSI